MNPSACDAVRIRILPSGTTVTAKIGESVYEFLVRVGVDTAGVCGGAGLCHKCLVRFLDPKPTPCPEETAHLTSAQLAQGWRLACRHIVQTNTAIYVPAISDPSLQRMPVTTPSAPPRLEALRLDALAGRHQEPQGRPYWLGSSPCPPWPDPSNTGSIRLALDIGTTSLAGQLIDAASRRVLANAATANPQSLYGADVMTRIRFVQQDVRAHTHEMHRLVHQGIAAVLIELERRAGASLLDVGHVAIVGNPTMLHLVLGVSPVSLGRSPYQPAFADRIVLRAEESGLPIRSDARIDILPGISGFVGADLIAGIYAVRLCQQHEPELLIDLGTNGELALWTGRELLVTSTAAGPAFEAASISCGMRAVDGAIDRVILHGGEPTYSVIGGGTPRGLCGSGLVDAIAVCRHLGLIGPHGRILHVAEDRSGRVVGSGQDARIVLVDDTVTLTQRDIRELQLAKGAVRAGFDTLLAHAGLHVGDLRRIAIAGALGSNPEPAHLFEIGLLPAEAESAEIEAPGNTACLGAARLLESPRQLEQADHIARAAHAMNLGTDPTFRRAFARHMALQRQ